MKKYEWGIVGGGIAGIAIGEILSREGHTAVLIEKNKQLASETTREFHEWIHTGALYTLVPDKFMTLKFILGAIDDLLEYYNSFERMNLNPTTSGLLINENNLNGWFTNNYIHFKYRLKGRKLTFPWIIGVARSLLINEKYPVEEGLYRIISRKAVDIYLSNTNKFKHIKIMHKFGLKKDYISMEQGLRKFGSSGFNIKKKIEFAIDYITTYSYKPLIYSSMFGFLLSILFMFISGLTVSAKLLGYINVPGWTSVIVFVSFLSSILFLNLAIIGIYLTRTIEEVKDKEQNIIEQKV